MLGLLRYDFRYGPHRVNSGIKKDSSWRHQFATAVEYSLGVVGEQHMAIVRENDQS